MNRVMQKTRQVSDTKEEQQRAPVEPHPVLVPPTPQQARILGPVRWQELMEKRGKLIALERQDPIRYGWEPPMWRIADALLGLPTLDKAMASKIRKALGFQQKVKVLLIMGGNRAGKTEYAVKRQMQTLLQQPKSVCWAFHQTWVMSRDVHHPLYWKYLPVELRRQARSEIEYLSYKQKVGFTQNSFVLANGSTQVFKFYSMDPIDALQSAEIDSFWCDELVPPEWIDQLMMRIASRDGWGVVTFTPRQGYSPTVRLFLDGGGCALYQTAFMLPDDGGEPDVMRELGFDNEGLFEWYNANGAYSRSTDFRIEEENGNPKIRLIHPSAPSGRRFRMMPRVIRCANPNFGVLYFFSSDNPYGRPDKVLQVVAGRSEDYMKECLYGFAKKTFNVQFPKFNRRVHVVPAKAIPQEGTNYHFVDPASGRNFLMHWYRVTREGVYLYREWPGNYPVPGIGFLGPWAIPDGAKLDGRPGPGQQSLGWGLLRLKAEIARLEGWHSALGKFESGRLDLEDVRFWASDGGAKEIVFKRYIDSRAASSPRMENDRPRTLQTDFEDIGLFFELTPGDDIAEGIELINDALDYDADAELSFFNKPRLYISEECENAIFALETWTGADGQKGACKDPIDLLRYALLAKIEYVSGDFWQTSGGGYY